MHIPVITAEQLSRGHRKPLTWILGIALIIGIAAACVVFAIDAIAHKACADSARTLFSLQHEIDRDPKNLNLRQAAMRERMNAEALCKATAEGWSWRW
jgi:hypothetical protein